MTEPEQDSVAFEGPAYRAAVVDLLGAITYGEISAFQRLTDDAKLATLLEDKLALGKMAVVQFGHIEPLMERIVWPKPAWLTMALCGVMVPGPFWVFQYQRPVFQATAASFCTSQGLLRRSMPSASPAAL